MRRSDLFAHPGAPLQAASGLALAVTKTVRGEAAGSRIALLKDHASLINLLCLLVTSANAFLLAWAGILAARRSNIFTVMLTQFSFLIPASLHEFSGFLQPEALLVGAGSLFWITLLYRRRYRLAHPVVLGSLLALKLNFAPYFFSLFRWRKPRTALTLGLASAAVFLLWILFTFRNPFWALRYLSSYLAQRLPVGVPGPLVNPLSQLYLEQDQYLAFLLCTLGFFAVAALARRGQSPLKRRLVCALLTIAGVHLQFVLRHNQSHYVLPAVAAVPATLWLIFQLLRGTKLSLLLGGILLMLGWAQLPARKEAVRIKSYTGRLAEQDVVRLETSLRARPLCRVAASEPGPYAPAALAMGAAWVAPEWLEELRALYPLFQLEESGLGRPELPPTAPDAPCALTLRSVPPAGALLIDQGHHYRLYSLELKPAAPLRSGGKTK